jgi:NAD(P)-dependent dehydrogenase (short-subunit alcohol dehydrogenase family)
VNRRKLLDAFTDEDWRAVLGANLDGPFHVHARVLPGMKARRRGKIINICSLASEIGRPSIVPYAVSKGGVQMLTRALAGRARAVQHPGQRHRAGFFGTAMNAPLIDDPEFDAWVRAANAGGALGRTPGNRRRRGVPRLRRRELRHRPRAVRRRRIQRRCTDVLRPVSARPRVAWHRLRLASTAAAV